MASSPEPTERRFLYSSDGPVVVELEEPPYDPPGDDLVWVKLPSDWSCWVSRWRLWPRLVRRGLDSEEESRA